MTKTVNKEKLEAQKAKVAAKQAKKLKKAEKKAMYPEFNAGKKKVTMYYIIAIAVVFAIGITLALLTYFNVIDWTDKQALWRTNRHLPLHQFK